MKKALIFIIFNSLFILSSCNSFNVVRTVRTISENKLYLGSYKTIENEDLKKFDVYMYLDFYDKNSNREVDSLEFDKKINLNEEKLMTINNNFKDDSGNLLEFYDMSDYLKEYIGDYSTLNEYFKDNNHLVIFFSYGDLSDSEGLATRSIQIKKAGIYFFSTVSNSEEMPSYSFSKIYEDKVEWFKTI